MGQGLASNSSPAGAEGTARPKRTRQPGRQKRPQLVNANSLGSGVSHLTAALGSIQLLLALSMPLKTDSCQPRRGEIHCCSLCLSGHCLPASTGIAIAFTLRNSAVKPDPVLLAFNLKIVRAAPLPCAQVFVGSFRGRGPFGAKPAPKHSGPFASAAASSAPDAAEQEDSSGTESDTPAGMLQTVCAACEHLFAAEADL